MVPDEIPEEPPTRPDLETFPCPACVDDLGDPVGEVLVSEETATGYKQRRERCPECAGLLRVGREQMARWQQAHPRKSDRP